MVWLAAGIIAISIPVLNQTPVRVVLALPVLIFIPGYSLISALFSKEGDIDLTKRIALFIGVSVAVVSMIGPGLNFVLWGIRLDLIVISLTLFSMVLIFVAHYTRGVLPAKCHFPLLRELSGKRFYRQGEAGSTGFSVQSLSSVFLLPLS